MSEHPAAAPTPDRTCLLAEGEMQAVGLLANASNATLLVRLELQTLAAHAVYKPQAGEQPLWDFPVGTLCRREVAAYEVSAALGWDVVPPTLLRDGPHGIGSVQLFVPHDPRDHYFTLLEDEGLHPELVRLAVFDVLVNNADRKASHVMRDGAGRLVGCDHGLTFHFRPKLRTVIWDFADAPVPHGLVQDIRQLAAQLGRRSDVRAKLCRLLSEQEVEALRRRAEELAASATLPPPPTHARAYPWPLL